MKCKYRKNPRIDGRGKLRNCGRKFRIFQDLRDKLSATATTPCAGGEVNFHRVFVLAKERLSVNSYM